MANKVKDINESVKQWLHKDADGGWKLYLARAEETTKVDREYIFYGILGLYLAYLVAGSGARLACNLVAFLYPAFESVKALRTANKDDDTQWLTYWTVFGVFSLIDFGSERIMSYFPFYWVLKIGFLVYLFHSEARGAQIIWDKFLFPTCTKMDMFKTAGRAAPPPSRREEPEEREESEKREEGAKHVEPEEKSRSKSPEVGQQPEEVGQADQQPEEVEYEYREEDQEAQDDEGK